MKSNFDYWYSRLLMIALLFFVITVIAMTNGCANKEVIIKKQYVYVKSKLPQLHTYEYNKTLSLTLTGRTLNLPSLLFTAFTFVHSFLPSFKVKT